MDREKVWKSIMSARGLRKDIAVFSHFVANPELAGELNTIACEIESRLIPMLPEEERVQGIYTPEVQIESLLKDTTKAQKRLVDEDDDTVYNLFKSISRKLKASLETINA